MPIADRLAFIRQRIDTAAASADRNPASIRLIAIAKTFPASAVREAAAAGQREIGENRVQEAMQKMRETTDLPLHWHLVGHLQTNKVRKAVQAFATIHSVDRLELLEDVEKAALWAGRTPELLIQVDLAREPMKSGAPVDDVARLLDAAATCRAARVVGLMTLPPLPETPEDARPWFRRLRELRDRLLAAGTPPGMLRELSMGMSGDFEVAVQEGATMVRVGTAIFGER